MPHFRRPWKKVKFLNNFKILGLELYFKGESGSVFGARSNGVEIFEIRQAVPELSQVSPRKETPCSFKAEIKLFIV